MPLTENSQSGEAPQISQLRIWETTTVSAMAARRRTSDHGAASKNRASTNTVSLSNPPMVRGDGRWKMEDGGGGSHFALAALRGGRQFFGSMIQ